MLFSRFFAASGVCSLLALACACLPAAGSNAAQREQITEREHQRIEAALDKQADWQFTDAPLKDVIETVGERLGVNVYLDVSALEDFGIGTDTPVTTHLAGISGRSSLNLLLRDLDLAWMIRDGLLWISTIEELEAQLVTKTYPVGDLIRVAGGAAIDYDYDTLISAITSSIGTESWDAVGGPGSIEGIYASLVVSQVGEVHEQIELLLRGCRKLVQQLRDQPGSVPEPLVLDDEGGVQIRAELEKPTALEFQDAPLDVALEHIALLHSIPIVTDTTALEDFGIGRDTPITFEMKRLPLRNTLRVLLGELDLTWVVRDEVLLVTTTEEAESLFQVVVYPVRDLVTTLEEANHEQYLSEAARTGKYDFDSLIDTITATVGPESWDAVGGPGAIEILHTPTALLISQTENVQEQVLNLLAKMRRMKSVEQRRLDEAAQAETETHAARHFIKAYPLTLFADERVVNQVIELLEETLGPEIWRKDSRALLRPVGNTIVVRHTQRVHRTVQRLLQELRAWSPPAGGPSQPTAPGSGFPGGSF